MKESNYKISGISILEAKLIEDFNRTHTTPVEYREILPKKSDSSHDELTTIALVGGINLLTMIAAYYFGKSEREEVVMKVETIEPDGTEKRAWIKVDRSSNTPVENQIVAQLKDLAKM